jgi:hypothetical protein
VASWPKFRFSLLSPLAKDVKDESAVLLIQLTREMGSPISDLSWPEGHKNESTPVNKLKNKTYDPFAKAIYASNSVAASFTRWTLNEDRLSLEMPTPGGILQIPSSEGQKARK